jgi:release factor glutamine methyltransferase
MAQRVETDQLLTVGLALRLGTASLRTAGVETAALDMSLLLAEALGLTRLQVYTQSDRPLDQAERARARELLARRIRREPLAYILGQREFMGLDFKVSPAVLIPRPETELLVELTRDWLLARLAHSPAPRVADIGTGSGAIILALAHALHERAPGMRFIATDLSPAALALARENAERLGLLGRLTWRQGSLLEPLACDLQAGEHFDAIVSNPPYVPEAARPTLAPEILNFEPHQALFSAEDGLAHLRALIATAPQYLQPGGLLALECGGEQAAALAAAMQAGGQFEHVTITPDLAGIPRIVSAQHI